MRPFVIASLGTDTGTLTSEDCCTVYIVLVKAAAHEAEALCGCSEILSSSSIHSFHQLLNTIHLVSYDVR